MAALNRDILLNLLLKTDQLERSSRKAADSLAGINAKADGVVGSLKTIARTAGVAFGAREIIRFGTDAVMAFANVQESINAVNVVFGDASDKVLRFSADTTDAVFIAEGELNQLATVTGALLTGVGLSMDDAADKTINLANRAADMASVFNTDVPDAVGAINAALRGESEPIRRYGVLLDEASVAAKALELGIADSAREMTQQDKVIARYALLMEQTAKFQGDAAATADSLPNRIRAMQEQWAKIQATLGEALLPVAEAVLDVFDRMAPILDGIAQVLPALNINFGNLADELERMPGPAGDLIGKFNDLRSESGLLDVAWVGVRDTMLTMIPGASAVADAIGWMRGEVEDDTGAVEEAFGAVADAISNVARATRDEEYAKLADKVGLADFNDQINIVYQNWQKLLGALGVKLPDLNLNFRGSQGSATRRMDDGTMFSGTVTQANSFNDRVLPPGTVQVFIGEEQVDGVVARSLARSERAGAR